MSAQRDRRTYDRERRARRKAARQCVRCGDALSEFVRGVHCGPCAHRMNNQRKKYYPKTREGWALAYAKSRESQVAYSRRRYAERKEEGECLNCGVGAEDDSLYCGDCRARVNERQRAAQLRRYRRLVREKVCVDCGAWRAVNGTRCATCGPKFRGRNREREARRRATCVAHGKCVTCQVALAAERVESGRRQCPDCADANSKRIRARRAARLASGDCAYCDARAVPGRACCERCLMMDRAKRLGVGRRAYRALEGAWRVLAGLRAEWALAEPGRRAA